MDLQYGIAINNKYALFIDEDVDPLEILRQKEEEAKLSKKDDKKAKSKTTKKTVQADAKPKQSEQTVVKKEEKVSGGFGTGFGTGFTSSRPQGERGGGRGGRGRELRENDSRPPRRQGQRESRDGFRGDENVPPEFRERGDGMNNRDRRERSDSGFEPRGRGRGNRGGRGRGGRGGPRPEGDRGGRSGGFGDRREGGGFGAPGERRREFDRHSGTDRTGIKPMDKRDGSGAHNWGSYRDDVDEQNTSQNPADESGEWPAATNTSAENQDNPDLNESGEPGSPQKTEEEENKEMTLDEWKALQGQSRMKTHFNLRKPGEGGVDKQLMKGVAYTKKKEESDEEDYEEEEEDDRHGHRKHLVTDIRITFADNPRRGGRGTGGRGGGRGRGGPRSEGRGGRGRSGGFGAPDRRGRGESAPRMDDETDFPRLVKSEA